MNGSRCYHATTRPHAHLNQVKDRTRQSPRCLRMIRRLCRPPLRFRVACYGEGGIAPPVEGPDTVHVVEFVSKRGSDSGQGPNLLLRTGHRITSGYLLVQSPPSTRRRVSIHHSGLHRGCRLLGPDSGPAFALHQAHSTLLRTPASSPPWRIWGRFSRLLLLNFRRLNHPHPCLSRGKATECVHLCERVTFSPFWGLNHRSEFRFPMAQLHLR